MKTHIFYERRGTMIYTEGEFNEKGEYIKGSSKFIRDCQSVKIAQEEIDELNKAYLGKKE